jgi:hypothetical protein
MGKKDYTEVLLEEMNGKINLILEVVVPMRKEVTEMKQPVSRIPYIEADIKTIKLALKQTNVQVRDHETRITKLEATGA